MKKRQDNPPRASALQVTLSIALISVLAIVLSLGTPTARQVPQHFQQSEALSNFAAPENSAATITVTNTNNSSAGSFRQALADANDGDTIDFDASVTGTIMLISGQLSVEHSVTISGPGANVLSVN